MRKYICILFMSLLPLLSWAQTEDPFNTTINYDEHKIFIRMNLYDKDITVPGNDILGQVDGYIGSSQSKTKWIIIASHIVSKTEAEIDVVNDYGSEDFTATLKVNPDGTYSYKKKGGSTLKFAVKGKWQKLPSNITFKKK